MKKGCVFIVLILVAGIIALFVRFGTGDARALREFSAAYTGYDQAIAAYSAPVLAPGQAGGTAVDELELKAQDALVLLNQKALVRISSLTKNDGELMLLAMEIAEVSGEEFQGIQAVQKASTGKPADLDKLANEVRVKREKRQTDYARFQELAR